MAQVTGFDYLKAFDQAAEEILEEVLGESAVKGAPVAQFGSAILLQPINVNVGIAGALAGYVRLGMDLATAKAVAGVMLGEEVTELEEMSLSALSELGNMIAGSARSHLNEGGQVSDITPPSILFGEGAKEIWYNLRTVSIPLQLSMGTVFLAVGVRPSTVRPS